MAICDCRAMTTPSYKSCRERYCESEKQGLGRVRPSTEFMGGRSGARPSDICGACRMAKRHRAEKRKEGNYTRRRRPTTARPQSNIAPPSSSHAPGAPDNHHRTTSPQGPVAEDFAALPSQYGLDERTYSRHHVEQPPTFSPANTIYTSSPYDAATMPYPFAVASGRSDTGGAPYPGNAPISAPQRPSAMTSGTHFHTHHQPMPMQQYHTPSVARRSDTSPAVTAPYQGQLPSPSHLGVRLSSPGVPEARRRESGRGPASLAHLFN